MSKEVFFPERKEIKNIIYCYTKPGKDFEGLINIGWTSKSFDERIKQQFPKKSPDGVLPYTKLLEESAVRSDGTFFKDHEVHKVLENAGFERVGGEWFRCKIDDVKSAIVAVRNYTHIELSRTNDFKLRPEQKLAVSKTVEYFKNIQTVENRAPRFLWNCKMRFGKTFATYKLAQEMNWSKVLILTFKPAVQSAWKEDLLTHVDFKDWDFVSKGYKDFSEIKKNKPFVCFASFQDFLGKNSSGGIKIKNQWAHKIDWDCIVLDEYHFGAWRDTAKELYNSEENNEKNSEGLKEIEIWNEEISPLKTKGYLYLSGTPFRALSEGEFIEEQIFNWTYMDEQKAKKNWTKKSFNPYESLPRMVMMTYSLPDSMSQITDTGEFNQFDLNEFFSTEGSYESAKFKYEDEVQKWLNLIRGTDLDNIYTNLKLGGNKPILPFDNSRLLNILSHTLWFLPSVASCYAMKDLLRQEANNFFNDFEIIVAAGNKAGVGVKALEPVKKKMNNPLETKTITLSCGKLTTGVTVRPWSGLFMLRNTSTPETYFQTAFRVQSPWVSELEGSSTEILKKECYVFDFAPNRALRLISDYSCRLDIYDSKPEQKVREFIQFLPVICFDGSSMQRLNAEEVLDMGLIGTTGSQLAKKFESARLVNVDNDTLIRLLNDENILEALMRIEGFSSLKEDISKIINKSETINELKKESTENELSEKKKKVLSDEQKKQKDLRRKVRDNMIRLATRIPVFMYLTDYREERLKDVITQLEPALFKKVTGIEVFEFEQLLSLGLMNDALMNDAVFAFKRFENSSLNYAGGFTKYKPDEIGLFDTKLTIEEFESLQ